MFFNRKKKAQQQADAAARSEAAASETTLTEAAYSDTNATTTTTKKSKIHIHIKFKPEWNSNDKILKTLHSLRMDVLLHKCSPSGDGWHYVMDLYGTIENAVVDVENVGVENTETASFHQQKQLIQQALRDALMDPNASVEIKEWHPRRRRQKMQSTPAGVGNGLFLGSNASGGGNTSTTTTATSVAEASDTTSSSKQPKTKTKQWGVPAKIVLQDEHGNDNVVNVRLSNESVQDLMQGGGNARDYHGYPLTRNGRPTCLLTAQVVDDDHDIDDHDSNKPAGLKGFVRKPSL